MYTHVQSSTIHNSKRWKQTKYLLMNELDNQNMVYINKMEYCSTF